VLEQTTKVPTPWWVRVLVWLVLPAVGAALVFLVLRVARLLPLPRPFHLIDDLPEPASSIGAATLGALLGIVLAVLVDRESLTVRISLAEVELSRPGTIVAVSRPDVAVAFPDRDQLVLLGRTGRELAREPSLLPPVRLRTAFTANGIAWAEQDPYLAAYRRWVPGLPELPAAAHALLAARQKAIEAGDDNDKRELRAELGRLGYVIRDDRKRQHWRQADG
jgi:hypothetical protein